MKANLFVITLFFIAIQISSAKKDKKAQLIEETQYILNTGNPYCVFYRNVVNAYIREIAPTRKCQLRCHNQDYFYAKEFPNWYLPNNFPVDLIGCGKKADDCCYKFDEDWMYGKAFLANMSNAEVFLDYMTRRLLLCDDDK